MNILSLEVSEKYSFSTLIILNNELLYIEYQSVFFIELYSSVISKSYLFDIPLNVP